jgi:uncharacterized protein YbjT (DUF2867 family)
MSSIILNESEITVNQPTILVTGATGKVGSAVVAQLRARSVPVRAVVHRHDARSERLERLGAETVVADLYDYDQLFGAMRGASRAFFAAPFHAHMIHSAVAFAVAARDARLESVVAQSQWLASPTHPSLATRQHWLVDRLFAMMPDVALTIVNPGLFAEEPYLSTLRYAALLGIYPLPADGASRTAPPSVDDIARVAVAALIDPAKHAGKTYRPTGPDSISVDEAVSIVSRVLGRTVRHVRLPWWLFYKAARMERVNAFQLASFRDYMHELDLGTFAFGAPTSDVYDVTGVKPESFASTVKRYAALPEMQPTLGNVLRAVGDFMTVPFRPGVNPATYVRDHGFPQPPAPSYDMGSERWKFEHAMQSATSSGTRQTDRVRIEA